MARLNSFYKMKMVEKLSFAPLKESLIDMVMHRHSMQMIIDNDVELLKSQQAGAIELAITGDELKKRREGKKKTEENLFREVKLIKRKKQEQAILLKKIREEKEAGVEIIDSLRVAARELDNKIKSFTESNAEKSGQISFEKLSGHLDMPVKGQIISRFGPQKNSAYSAFTFQSGIDIKVERGEPVKTVFKGKVIYSQWLKGYGNVIIIDHGNSFYTLYAHLEDRFKQKGSKVNTNEVIATAGATGSLKGVCLHFEIRHHGTPVDPLNWLKKGV
ncbi:Putative metallopeptidase (fragment) [Desulfamplus magnetovallimortis]|uniref:Putative metallopeptidase n=1 Tax=Desulfamplus magnetovallimortis TaxID=1246637 RepID=A0A1W1HIM1_9BACT